MVTIYWLKGFKIERIIEIDRRYFFYRGSISSANIDSETPPAKTGEVSESDFKSYTEGDQYCPTLSILNMWYIYF